MADRQREAAYRAHVRRDACEQLLRLSEVSDSGHFTQRVRRKKEEPNAPKEKTPPHRRPHLMSRSRLESTSEVRSRSSRAAAEIAPPYRRSVSACQRRKGEVMRGPQQPVGRLLGARRACRSKEAQLASRRWLRAGCGGACSGRREGERLEPPCSAAERR